MFFAKFIIDDVKTSQLYFDWEQFHKDTFNPCTLVVSLVEFKIHGKYYQSRKASLHDLAVDWSYAETDGISYGELLIIQNWFEKNGKRYGLLEEFRENAIC